MTPEERAGLEAFRDFLKPTLRGKMRAAAHRISRRLFPPKPIPLFRAGDIVELNGKQKTVVRCRGRFVEFSDGSEMVVA